MSLDLIVHQHKIYTPSMYHGAQETSQLLAAIRHKESIIERQRRMALGKHWCKQDHNNNANQAFRPITPVCLPLIRIIPFINPRAPPPKYPMDDLHQVFTETASICGDDDNVFLPPCTSSSSTIASLTTPMEALKLGPRGNSSPPLSHTETLSPNELHLPIESLFQTSKLNKKLKKKISKRRVITADKAISLADLESKLIKDTPRKRFYKYK